MIVTVKNKLLILGLFNLLMTGMSYSEPQSNPTYTGSVEFVGRSCTPCKYTLRQGYLRTVVHPREGKWDISTESSAMVNGKFTRIDPQINKIPF